jgi:hypothetical protein
MIDERPHPILRTTTASGLPLTLCRLACNQRGTRYDAWVASLVKDDLS